MMDNRESKFSRCLSLFSDNNEISPRVVPLSAVAVNGAVVSKSPPASSTPPPSSRPSAPPHEPPPLLPTPPASAREFLLSRPRGAYTALAVSASGCAQFWQEHCERLAATLALLSEKSGEEEGQGGREPPPFPLFGAWHASSEGAVPLPLASLLGDALLPGVRAAVAAVREMQREEERQQEREILEAAGLTAAASTAREEGAAPLSSRCDGRGAVNVAVLLSEPVAAAEAAAGAAAEEEQQRQQQRRHPGSLPLDFAVFAWEASPPPPPPPTTTTTTTPAAGSEAEAALPVLSAAVVGGPRRRPHAKDSLWASAREPLERKLSEAILARLSADAAAAREAERVARSEASAACSLKAAAEATCEGLAGKFAEASRRAAEAEAELSKLRASLHATEQSHRKQLAGALTRLAAVSERAEAELKTCRGKLRAARREASRARREARAAGRARREAGAVVLAALRDVRRGEGRMAGEEEEEGTEAGATPNDSAAAPEAAPLSYSSLTPGQKEAALQLLFSRLRNVVFFPRSRRSSGGGCGGGE